MGGQLPSFALLCAVLAAGRVDLAVAQQKGEPRNDLPQPYRTTRDWGDYRGVKWAAVTAIEPAPDGTIFVVHRCFANSCAGRPEAPILKYDARGKLLGLVRAGMFVFPHGAPWIARGTSGSRIGQRAMERGTSGAEVQPRLERS